MQKLFEHSRKLPTVWENRFALSLRFKSARRFKRINVISSHYKILLMKRGIVHKFYSMHNMCYTYFNGMKNINNDNQEIPRNIVILTISGILGGFIALILVASLSHLSNFITVAFSIWLGISIITLAILRVIFRSKLIKEKKFPLWW
jgi:hypothetical protein